MTHPLHAWLARAESDARLLAPHRWSERHAVLDALDLHLPGPGLDRGGTCEDESAELDGRARVLVARLEAADVAFFDRIRHAILSGHGADALRACRADARTEAAPPASDGQRYDALDALVAGVMRLRAVDALDEALDEDMVPYQPTPATQLFELFDHLALTGDDTLIDLGSGLGHAVLLAAMCTPACCVGVELQRALVDSARRCARSLRLQRARFRHADARATDLSSGTVFYLYTPFSGAILRTVLDAIRQEARTRTIRVCTFGPCTTHVAGESWLQAEGAVTRDRIATFRSRLA